VRVLVRTAGVRVLVRTAGVRVLVRTAGVRVPARTGNALAGDEGADLRDLMDRMSSSSTRAALIYLHRTKARDKRIADTISRRVQPNDRVRKASDD
jgi:hypothetical protein